MNKITTFTLHSFLFISALLSAVTATADSDRGFSLSFTSSFSPTSVAIGDASTFEFIIGNSQVPAVGNMNFTNNLPMGLTLATPANLISSCGGTLSAPDGGAQIVLSGGLVAANSSCSISVDVSSNTASVYESSPLAMAVVLSSDVGTTDLSPQTLTVTQPMTFSSVFLPDNVGIGNISMLQYTLTNLSAIPVTDIAFTNNFPVGLVLADFADPMSDCGGILSAVNMGTQVQLSDAAVAGFGSCTITLNVKSSTAGNYENSPIGSQVSLMFNLIDSVLLPPETLIVNTSQARFSKAFSPNTILFGETSRLTFTIENPNPAVMEEGIQQFSFVDDLPTGMVIANPVNFITDCSLLTSSSPFSIVTISADAGASQISVSGFINPFFTAEFMPGGEICTVALDVVSTSLGTLINTSQNLNATFVPDDMLGTQLQGKANAGLQVDFQKLLFNKSFTDDPVSPGGEVTLEFTISNFDRDFPATNVSFSDDLDMVVSGLVATGLPLNDVCGIGSQISGTSLLTLTGGTIPNDQSCTFSVTLDVPALAVSGSYTNTSGAVAATIDGNLETGNQAIDVLVISPISVVKRLVDQSVMPATTITEIGAGAMLVIEFVIANNSATSAASDIDLTDRITDFITGATIAQMPALGSCGSGIFSQMIDASFGSIDFIMTGGDLAALSSCTFYLVINVPEGTSLGLYQNVTSSVSATVGGSTHIGKPAVADITVLAGPQLTKLFTDDPVLNGDTVTLEFTLSHDLLAPSGATDVSFSDDLDIVLSGLEAIGLPMNDICGIGSLLTGTSIINFSGGNLMPGNSCTFSVTLQVPLAGSGTFTNTTTAPSSTVNGITAISPAAEDDLQVIGDVSFSKSFLNDPVLPGGTVDLQFTISNASADNAVTSISFSDSFSSTLDGMTVVAPLPVAPCGGSLLVTNLPSGDTLNFFNGSLATNSSCNFTITLTVPVDTLPDTYTNITSNLSAVIGANPASIISPAIDSLVVDPLPQYISLSKTFIDNPTFPGGTATLEFTISNDHLSMTANNIAFTDVLDANLAGLTASGLPQNGSCSAGSSLSGTSTLTFTGGSLIAGASCTFSVNVDVPLGAVNGAAIANTTSPISSDLGLDGGPASDTLLITIDPAPGFSKQFIPNPVGLSQPVSMVYTIDNTGSSSDVGDLQFSDTLPTNLVVSATPNGSSSCVGGTLSAVAGSSTVNYSSGSASRLTSCSVQLDVVTNLAGDYLSTSGSLSSDLGFSGQAFDTLSVVECVATPNDLIAWWAGEDNGLNLYGLNDASLQGGLGFIDGIVGRAFDFDGIDDLLSVADTSDLDLSTNDFSIGFWIRPLNDNTTGVIINKLMAEGYQVYLNNGMLGVRLADGTMDLSFDSTAPLLQATWYHVMFTLDRDNSVGGKLYLNGVDVFTFDPTTVAGSLDTNADFTMGSALAASLDEVELYRRALSMTEALSIFDANLAGKCTADIAISKVGDLSDVVVGNPLEYTITLDNISQYEALNVSATETLPAGVSFVSTSGCAEDPIGVPVCTLGNIAALTSSQYTVSVTVDSDAADTFSSVTNTVMSRSNDLNNSNDTANEITGILAEADLSITKTGSADPVAPNTGFNYTITVSNSGPSAAQNVVMSDILPANLGLVSTSGCAEDPMGVPTCSLGTLANGGSLQINLSVNVGAAATVSISNTASVSSDANDSNMSNNSATDITTVDDTAPTVVLVNTSADTGDGELSVCENTAAVVNQFHVVYSESVQDPAGDTDPDDVTNPANYQLIATGEDLSFSTSVCGSALGDDIAFSIDSVSYDDLSQTATLTVNAGLDLNNSVYRLLVCGSTSIRDIPGNPLDGTDDGVGGDDFTRQFRIEQRNLFSNGYFDCSLDGWTLVSDAPEDIEYSSVDINNSNVSGSALISNTSVSTDFSIGQCINWTTHLLIEGWVQLSAAMGVTIDLTQQCEFFDNTDCSGNSLATDNALSQLTDTQGQWQQFSTDTLAPLSTLSARCDYQLHTTAADAFDAYLDTNNLVESPLFRDGFESLP